MQTNNQISLLMTKPAAAQALAISVRSLEKLIASKHLAVRRIGRRVLVPRQALEMFARRDHITAMRRSSERSAQNDGVLSQNGVPKEKFDV